MDDSTLRERAPSWPLVLFIGTAGLTVIGCSPNESKLPDRASEYVSVVTHVESESVKEDVWLANSRHEWDPRERLPWNGKPGPLLPGCSLTFLRRRVEIDLVNGSSSFALMRTFNPPNETAFSSQEELLLHLAETLDSFDTLCVYGGVWSGLS